MPAQNGVWSTSFVIRTPSPVAKPQGETRWLRHEGYFAAAAIQQVNTIQHVFRRKTR